MLDEFESLVLAQRRVRDDDDFDDEDELEEDDLDDELVDEDEDFEYDEDDDLDDEETIAATQRIKRHKEALERALHAAAGKG